MKKVEVIGLATDEPSLEYLTSRGISHARLAIEELDCHLDKWRYTNTRSLIHGLDGCDTLLDGKLHRKDHDIITIVPFGSSRYHHISHGLIRSGACSVYDSFTIVNIDNHDDCNIRTELKKQVYVETVTYGDHIKESLIKTNAEDAIHIRNRDIDIGFEIFHWRNCGTDGYEPFSPLIHEYNYRNCKPLTLDDYVVDSIMQFCKLPVYLTIDIDALHPEDVDVNPYETYFQGMMRADDLIEIVGLIAEKDNLIGVDICGMTPDPRCFGIYDWIIETIQSKNLTSPSR
ncbi:hypothetical protein COV93_06330 [Candidatus Woesearchaeota archaeon CG11_big_fil_rev_8_21_14_0_20_43_8]|nr:MAG: hypothetical protein COV93_06330 [Candidatus Woesearchaeota archaeon CG11_big_fil_rev_8_21_14_0_20_43_8]PIO04694.1 MAG: hypothetical protein COT47_07945 [Candidatus Woesearchaeota archaeon CG08_land_8_20_14_0_20_43_7]